eukprot:scaffold6446_cov104-Isochrysis_galbana.AAC.1
MALMTAARAPARRTPSWSVRPHSTLRVRRLAKRRKSTRPAGGVLRRSSPSRGPVGRARPSERKWTRGCACGCCV